MKEDAEKLRIGVIGVGLLGERHTRFWAQQPDVELVAVADGRLDRAQEVAGRWNVPAAYQSAEELIERARPDAVSVATPDFVHREPVVAALQGGAHVLVEKPLALTTEDARAMIAAAERADRRLMVNHSMRWVPSYSVLKSSIVAGELGEPVSAHSSKSDTIYVPTQMLSWASRSTPAYFLTAHDYDLVRWFFDDEAVEVYAQGAWRVLKGRGIDTPDVVQTSVRFRGGAVASFEASWILPNTFPALTDNYMHVFGSSGSVFLDRGRESVESFGPLVARYPKYGTVYEHEGRIYGSFRHALEHFVQSVRSGTEPLTSAQRVYGVVALLEALHRSLESRRPEPVEAGLPVGTAA